MLLGNKPGAELLILTNTAPIEINVLQFFIPETVTVKGAGRDYKAKHVL